MFAVPLATGFSGPVSLQDAAGRVNMYFGAAVRATALADDSTFRATVARECGIVTPEVELKWAWIEPKPGEMHFEGADQIARFANQTGKAMHGHALLWHRSIPGWAMTALAERPDWAVVQRFLAAVVGRYGTGAKTWDVVNEPLDMGHRMDGLRPSPFLQAFGPDYVARALHEARRLAPNATLFVNEFGLDYDLPWQRDKRYHFLKLLERLQASGTPIDGVGLQAHLELEHQTAFSERILADFLSEIGQMGLQIRISELDVKEADRALPIAERDRRVADAVARYLDVAVDNRAVGSITCWGLSDRYSWLDDTAPGNRGLPLDADFVPKPFHRAIRSAIDRRNKVNP